MRTFLNYCLLAGILLGSCDSNTSPSSSSPATTTPAPVASVETIDTITSLDAMGSQTKVWFKAPNGKYYLLTNEPVTEEENEEGLMAAPASVAGKLATDSKRNKACESENFDGKDRKASKISIDRAKMEDFDRLADLMKTLPKDKAIGDERDPAIPTGPESGRVKEEKRNVRINRVWLYTFSREADEDYHVIIGSTPNKKTAVFFNVEISGLPPRNSSAYAKLKKTRDTFRAFFGIDNQCFESYRTQFINNPIEVRIAGSLFFDQLHYRQGANVGPAAARSKSYWEIHPVTELFFY